MLDNLIGAPPALADQSTGIVSPDDKTETVIAFGLTGPHFSTRHIGKLRYVSVK